MWDELKCCMHFIYWIWKELYKVSPKDVTCSHLGEEASQRLMLSVDHTRSHTHSKKLNLKLWPVEFSLLGKVVKERSRAVSLCVDHWFKLRLLASTSNVNFLDKHSCVHANLQRLAAVQISPFIFLYLANAASAVLVLWLLHSSWLSSSGACNFCRASVCRFSSCCLHYCPILWWLLTQVLGGNVAQCWHLWGGGGESQTSCNKQGPSCSKESSLVTLTVLHVSL